MALWRRTNDSAVVICVKSIKYGHKWTPSSVLIVLKDFWEKCLVLKNALKAFASIENPRQNIKKSCKAMKCLLMFLRILVVCARLYLKSS